MFCFFILGVGFADCKEKTFRAPGRRCSSLIAVGPFMAPGARPAAGGMQWEKVVTTQDLTVSSDHVAGSNKYSQHERHTGCLR